MANVTIRRANVVLEISDDEATVSKYLADGFDVIGAGGKVVRSSTHGKSENALRVEIDRLRSENDRLASENNKLTEEVKDLKDKLDALVVAEKEQEDVPEEQTIAAPKKKRPAKTKD